MSSLEVTTHDSIEQVNRNQWNDVVENAELGSLFHRYQWLEACENALDVDPLHLVLSKNGTPVGVFPNFVAPVDLPDGLSALDHLSPKQVISSRPGFGGPILLSSRDEGFELLLDTLAEHSSRSTLFHCIRMSKVSCIQYGKRLERRGYEPKLSVCRFVLDIDQCEEDVYANMDSDKRRSLRRAHENDAEVRIEKPTKDNLSDTYDAYVQNTVRAGGDALPHSFFEELANGLSDCVRLFSVVADGREVGRSVVLLDEQESMLHQQYLAIPDESCYKYYPTALLVERSIEWGQANGYETVDLGPTDADFSVGTFRHKKQFGCNAIPLIVWERGFSKLGYAAYNYGRKFYR